MKYTIDKHDRYIVIEPHVEVIDAENAAKLKGEFLLRNTIGQRNIVLDMVHVQKTDEVGIRLGILAHRLCQSVGGVFILVNLCPKLMDMVRVSHLDKSLRIAPSLKVAEDLIFAHELESEYRGTIED
nr:STAS domain-containing protein [uncultured Sphingobacterium sp.]